jgi:hypothetical protein
MVHQKSFHATGKKACKETLKVYFGIQPDAMDLSNAWRLAKSSLVGIPAGAGFDSLRRAF